MIKAGELSKFVMENQTKVLKKDFFIKSLSFS